jgi:hypothetical protein
MKETPGYPVNDLQLSRKDGKCSMFVDCPFCGREDWFDNITKGLEKQVVKAQCDPSKHYLIRFDWTPSEGVSDPSAK